MLKKKPPAPTNEPPAQPPDEPGAPSTGAPMARTFEAGFIAARDKAKAIVDGYQRRCASGHALDGGEVRELGEAIAALAPTVD